MPDNEATVNPMFSIDHFVLSLKMPLTDLKILRRSENLKQHARYVIPLPAEGPAAIKGYHSHLDVSKFDDQLLPILSRLLQNIYHRVTSIEITCDVPHRTREDAIKKFHQIYRVLRKRWSSGVWLYEESKATQNPRRRTRRRSVYDHELLYDKSIYVGGETFEYKVYVRKFPGTDQPVVRAEWTIRTSDKIRKTVGIQTIDDLLELDLHRAFTRLYQHFIRYEEIDHERHGRFLLNAAHNAPRLRPTARTTKLSYSRQKTISYSYLRAKEIEQPTQLRQHYAQQKKRVAKKPIHRLSTIFDRRIRKLSIKRISSFLKTASDPLLSQDQ